MNEVATMVKNRMHAWPKGIRIILLFNSFLILKSSDIITTSVCPQDSQNYFTWIISIESYNLIKCSLLSLSDNSKVKKIIIIKRKKFVNFPWTPSEIIYIGQVTDNVDMVLRDTLQH